MSAAGESYSETLNIAVKHSQKWLDSIPTRDVNPAKKADEIKEGLTSFLP